MLRLDELGSTCRRQIGAFGCDESGATAIEYGLIAAIVAIGIVVSMQGVRTELQETFAMIGGKFAPFLT